MNRLNTCVLSHFGLNIWIIASFESGDTIIDIEIIANTKGFYSPKEYLKLDNPVYFQNILLL